MQSQPASRESSDHGSKKCARAGVDACNVGVVVCVCVCSETCDSYVCVWGGEQP